MSNKKIQTITFNPNYILLSTDYKLHICLIAKNPHENNSIISNHLLTSSDRIIKIPLELESYKILFHRAKFSYFIYSFDIKDLPNIDFNNRNNIDYEIDMTNNNDSSPMIIFRQITN